MVELFNEHSARYPFLKKGFFPSSIFFCTMDQYFQTLEAIPPCFVIASRTAYEHRRSFFQDNLAASERGVCVVSGEPTVRDIEACQERWRLCGEPALLVGFGGGSAMDVAKALKHAVQRPLVLIPTTFGTGSEATPYALLTDEDDKVVLSHRDLLPDVVIEDARLLKTIPREVMGFMVLDALSHCLEGFCSRLSNPLSDALAVESWRLMVGNMPQTDELSDAFFERMQVAGLLGGMVQGMASVGLTHALAHYIGPRYHLSHGEAIALFLRDVMVLNVAQPSVEKKLASVGMSAQAVLDGIDTVLNAFHIVPGAFVLDGSMDLVHAIAHVKKDVCTMTHPFRPTDTHIEELILSHVREHHS